MSRIIAVFLLIILIPLFVIIGLVIYYEDGGPIFFIQKRFGKNNSFFNIYKFRTMKNNTPDLATHLLQNPETFLLRVGFILRKLSLDELPNIINIAKGEMVFVGPRPALYNQYDLISLRVESGIDKLSPGITGWAQINGRDDITINEKIELEKEYLKKRSYFFDLVILIRTFLSIFSGKGIVH
jgi:O-antigen biosynthesis protein WbqP